MTTFNPGDIVSLASVEQALQHYQYALNMLPLIDARRDHVSRQIVALGKAVERATERRAFAERERYSLELRRCIQISRALAAIHDRYSGVVDAMNRWLLGEVITPK